MTRMFQTHSAKANTVQYHENCLACGLYKTCITPFMPYSGAGKLDCLIVAEAPGKTEDERGTQLIGQAGNLFKRFLGIYGKKLDVDFWKTNALICRPPKNKTPTAKQLKLCHRNLKHAIEELQPKFIWLLGASAVNTYYAGRKTDIGITKLRGLCVPDPEYKCYVFPMYHPSYVLRNAHDKNLEAVYKRDIKTALYDMERLKSTPPKELDISSPIKIATDMLTITAFFEILKKEKPITAFDFETSNLKPYDDQQFVWTMSVSTDDKAIAFPIHYPRGGILPRDTKDLLWRQSEYDLLLSYVENYLQDPKMKKVCHNRKFESVWSKYFFGEPKGLIWCTMDNQHILDDRRGTNRLKHQAFVRWGVFDYEASMAPYMNTAPIGKQGGNSLHAAPLNELLLYNGRDSYLTMKLFREQYDSFAKNKELNRCRLFYHEGSQALEDIQMEGICVDERYYNIQSQTLGKKIDTTVHNIHSHPVVKKLEQKTGQLFNLNSTQQLRRLFFEELGFPPVKFTATELISTDADTMSKINHPIAKEIVEYRKMTKIKDTYLAQFIRESENGYIHPFFDLHTVSTGRSSSSRPNFQNVPVRDEAAKKIIRSGIIPRPGHLILEVDYSSLEVRIIACYTQDGTLVSYIKDKSTDMHRDEAKNLFMLPEKEVTGVIRFFAKNGWVFPEFYGSYWGSCSKELWANVVVPNLETKSGIKIQAHLKKVGINNLDDFQEHLKAYEQVFWDRYPDVKNWHEAQFRFYRKNGHTKTFFGYQQRDYLSNNNLVNGPIQGTAFHCLLWSLIHINKIRKAENWRTKIIGQIHDSILFDTHPDELSYVRKTVEDVMCNKLRKNFPWIIVPMEIECEKTEIDQPWSTKEEWT